jgi:hypothetical protein
MLTLFCAYKERIKVIQNTKLSNIELKEYMQQGRFLSGRPVTLHLSCGSHRNSLSFGIHKRCRKRLS